RVRVLTCLCCSVSLKIRIFNKNYVAAVGFEPTPPKTGALNQRLRPLGHATG
ncbi:hypothetical protein ScPMuIL_007328, partial [Solemya velum]